MKQIDIDILLNIPALLGEIKEANRGGYVYVEPIHKRVMLWNNITQALANDRAIVPDNIRQKHLNILSEMIDRVAENNIFGVCELPAVLYENVPYATMTKNLGTDRDIKLLMKWFDRRTYFGSSHRGRHVLCEDVRNYGLGYIIYSINITSVIHNPEDFTPNYGFMIRFAYVKRKDELHIRVAELEEEDNREFMRRNGRL